MSEGRRAVPKEKHQFVCGVEKDDESLDTLHTRIERQLHGCP
jgi:hypothetical protein